MKKIYYFLLTLIPYFSAHSQITIDQSDMPAPGDTIRLSISASIPGDFTKTGNDTTWDFSALQAMNQRVDTFVTVVNNPSIPPVYLIFFIPNITTNLASPMGGAAVVPGVPVTNGFRFYKNSLSSFTDLGFAVELQGIPLPAKYDNPDIQYKFPLNPSTAMWTSNSVVSISIPGTGAFFSSRSRESQVDGWGTLITPFGTFATVRVKSHLVEIDSIVLDTGNFSFPVTRDIMEYKWMTKGQGEPVLQINQEGSVVTAVYRDIFRQNLIPLSVNLGQDTTIAKGATITITAHVSGGTPPYHYLWNTYDTTQTITKTINASQTFVVFAIDAGNNFTMGIKNVSVKNSGIDEANYRRLDVYPNPASGKVRFHLNSSQQVFTAELFNTRGQKEDEFVFHPSSTGDYTIDLSGHSSGFYILKIFNRYIYFSGISLQK